MDQLGRYLIQEEIGQGGMGIVYRAYDPDIDRNLALKVLRPEKAVDWEVTRRFLREAKAAGRLTHPNIVVIYDVGEEKGRAFIAMEYLSGCPLVELMEKGPLPLEDSLNYARQIALALGYAHKEGVVHRDIKPSNIIVGDDNKVKITDFGIARVSDVSLAEQTRTGQILGTPSYMSPEQIQGKKVDGRADLFSLGMILYEMLTGEKPFNQTNIASLFHAILNAEPPKLKEKVPAIPDKAEEIVSKALRKEPDERFQTGEELAGALSSLLEKIRPSAVPEVPEEKPAQLASHAKTPALKKVHLVFVAIILVAGAFGAFILTKPTQVVRENVTQGITGAKASSVSLPKNMGTVSFRTEPEGAVVYINGESKGNTPLNLILLPGTYEVKLEMPGYLSWEAQVNVEKNRAVPLEVSLTPQAGKKKTQGG